MFDSTIENPVIAVGCLLAVGGAGPNPAVDMREAVPPLYADVGLMVPLLLRCNDKNRRNVTIHILKISI